MLGRRRCGGFTWTNAVVAAVLVSLAISAVADAEPAAAGAPGGPFHFVTPTQLVDTRTGERASPGVVLGASEAAGFLHVTALDAVASGSIQLGPCGSTPTTTVLRYRPATPISNRVYVAAGECLTATAATHLTIQKVATWAAIDADGVSYVEITDPEADTSLDIAAPGSAFVTAGVRTVELPDAVPDSADGIAVLVAGLSTSHETGTITVRRCGVLSGEPTDVAVHQELAANVAYVRTPGDGPVCIDVRASPSAAFLASAEVVGYFTDSHSSTALPPTLDYHALAAPGLMPQAPARLLDTRSGLGTSQARKLAAGQVLKLDLGTRVNEDTEAVVMNVTATQPEAAGFLTVYDCSAERPGSSNLNFQSGQDVPNLVTTAIDSNGDVCIYSSATTHLLADMSGRYDLDAGNRFTAVDPARVLDTRTSSVVPAGEVLTVELAGRGGVPAGATAATFNLTSTQAEGAGYLTAYPCDQTRPNTSNVNYDIGQSVPNQVTVKLSAAGTVCIYTFATTHLIVDVAGYFTATGPGAGLLTVTPQRMVDTRQRGTPLTPGELAEVGMAADISALVANLTATQVAADGHAVAHPCQQAAPEVSSLNFVAGRDVANHATVKVDASGAICVSTSQPIHLLVDVVAVFTPEDVWYFDRREY